MLGNHDPTAHPGMEIAVDPKQLGLFEREGNAPRMRLRSVERGILLAGTSDVMQQPVAI